MPKIKSSGPSDAPETIRQAWTFDTMKRRYLRLGLCSACAAQAAWGHQLGFSRSNPPCADCQAAVDGFPSKRPNGWHASSPRHGAEFPPHIRRPNGSNAPERA